MKKTLMTAILFMGLSLFAQSEGRGNSGLIFFGGVGVSMLDESPVLTIDGRVQLEVTPWLNAG